MSTAQLATEHRFLLEGISWLTYTKLLKVLDERPTLRMTYDRGSLEFMTISHEHESYGSFLGRLAVILTEELDLPLKEGGSTTFRRRRKLRGLEPDKCFWIGSESLVRGKLHIDLRTDPRPDLAIEVDISYSSLDRLAIYASLGVSEVWRFDGQALTFHSPSQDGRYVIVPHSRTFPQLTPDDLLPFMAMRDQLDENAVAKEFRKWIRGRVSSGWKPK